ncbi:hypothetical protein GGQ68_003201 [Sagittula marina]|uniref:Restriction system protein Mrr-like N-terminal domain-containing protein n=1 Tax=Sagittula marina TaxID=943940 RepID=A0A7W6DQ21_9RHOB|nr:hypothetical protein [Sagittula marina]
MAAKADLQEWVLEALRDSGGEAHLTTIAKHIWEKHEAELRASGDLFYTWQYDMRWQAQHLKKAGKLEKLSRSWRLA